MSQNDPGKKTEKQYSFFSNTNFYFKEILTHEPMAALCLLIAVFCGILLPFLNARLPQLVLRGLEEGWELSLFIERILFLAALLAVTGIIHASTEAYLEPMSIPFLSVYNLKILKKRLSADYEVLENKHFHDEAYVSYDSLYRHQSEMRCGFVIWKNFLVAVISTALFGSILLTQSIWILLLVLFPVFLTTSLQKRASACDKKLRILAEASNRKMDYTARQTGDFRAGKDIRIYHLSSWLLGILRQERKISEVYAKRWENAYLGANCIDSVLNFLQNSCAYIFLIIQIVDGKMAVSDFVWYMAIIANCQQACSQVLAQGERLRRLNLDYGRIRHFLNGWNGTAFSGKWNQKTQTAAEIEFRHVSFTYPESDHATLKDLNFIIHPGEKIALVGLNGAGKTTLVKLLCGLYHPTQGEILVNGHDVKEYDREAYFQMINIVRYAGGIWQMVQAITDLLASWDFLHINRTRMEEFFTYLDLPEKKKKGTIPVQKRRDGRFLIEFRNVSFRYPGTKDYVLKNMNLRFEIGERVALVGANGSGKTTFVKLLCRLYDPTEGIILLNDVDIRKYRYEEYMRLFSVVFQDFQIFSFRLGEYIAGSPNVDSERALDAANRAGLSGLLSQMPDGLNTMIGKDFSEEGFLISGGEAQRLAMARAIYKDAPFVILDEPTAALDPVEENEIYTRFHEIIGNKTALFISHRLSACHFAKEILVFENGNIVQRGSHQELHCIPGLYQRMWQAQAKYYQQTVR